MLAGYGELEFLLAFCVGAADASRTAPKPVRFDARPITELIHRTGDWALIFLLVARGEAIEQNLAL